MTPVQAQPGPAHDAVRSAPADRDDKLFVPVLWNRDGPAPQDERDMFFTKEIISCGR